MAKIKMRIPSNRSQKGLNQPSLEKNGIYRLKIVLAGSDPPIWRRFLISGESTLSLLHWVIQRVMGWSGEHLHEFTIDKHRYGRIEDISLGFGPSRLDHKKYKIRDVLPWARKVFQYEYDFGDSWLHEVKVEAILPTDPDGTYPICLEGENACPPEDSGGLYGYYNKLRIRLDPNDPDHEEMKDWLGSRFDPTLFSLEGVNRSLRGLSNT